MTLVHDGSKMTLKYWMIVERHPNQTKWFAVQFSAAKSSLYLMGKLARWSSASSVLKFRALKVVHDVGLRLLGVLIRLAVAWPKTPKKKSPKKPTSFLGAGKQLFFQCHSVHIG